MKTMLTLIAMLLVGNAVAEPVFTPADVDRIVAEREARYQRLQAGPKMSDTIRPNDEAASPMKVDYSIVTLPDGKTASVLTFK
jgi:hypothetical protein